MSKKTNNLFSRKVFTIRTFLPGIIIAAIFSSCSKNNEEMVETQTNAVNTANLKKGQLDGQPITYERKMV
jgi:hypothetical protein